MATIVYDNLGKGLLQNYNPINLNSQQLRGYSLAMKNFYNLPKTTLKKTRGYSKLLDTAISGTPTVTSLFQFKKDTSGTLFTICTTSDGKVRLFNGSDADTELLTGLTTGVDLVWNWTIFDNGTDVWAIGANGTDFIKTDGTVGNTAVLGGSPPSNVQWVASFKKRLWAGSFSSNVIYFSGILNEESWDTTNDNLQFDEDIDFGISGLKAYNDVLYVSKEQALYYVAHRIPTLTTSSAFRVIKLLTENGFINGNSVVELPNGELEFLGKEGVYRVQGETVYNISSDFIKGYFDENLNFSTLNNTRGLYFIANKISSNDNVHYVFSTISSTNDEGIIHNYITPTNEGGWFPNTLQTFHCLAKYETSNRRTLIAGGIADGQIYLLDNTNNYSEISVDSEVTFLWDGLDNYNSEKQGKFIYFAFKSQGASQLTIGLSKDGDTASEVTRTISNIGSGDDSWGTFLWGTMVWGDFGDVNFARIAFEPHPDTGELGLGQFKRLQIRLANNETNEISHILAMAIEYTTVMQEGANRASA